MGCQITNPRNTDIHVTEPRIWWPSWHTASRCSICWCHRSGRRCWRWNHNLGHLFCWCYSCGRGCLSCNAKNLPFTQLKKDLFVVYVIMLSVSPTIYCWTDGWLVNNELDRIWKWSLSNFRYYPTTCWMDWGKPQETSVRRATILRKIHTKHYWNTHLEHYCYNNLLGLEKVWY
jgi:hypothetical protein